MPRCLWAVPEYLPEGTTAGHYTVLSPAPPRYQQGARTLAAPRDGTVVLITGASSGIWEATARACSAPRSVAPRFTRYDTASGIA
jgi:hypothetical protein